MTATGQTLKWSVGSAEVLDAAIARSGYSNWHNEQVAGNKRRGIGLSFFFHGAGFTGSGEAKMKAQAGLGDHARRKGQDSFGLH